jgi:lactoylglutathione lyase
MRLRFAIVILITTIAPSVFGQTKKQIPMNLKTLIPNLIVEDVNRTTEYYQRTFGFEIVMTVPDSGAFEFAMLKLDNVTIMFQSMKGFIEALPEYKDQKVGGTLFLYFDVENLDKIYNKAKIANADIVVDINTTFYGTREFTMKDCDGYLLIFAEEQEKE